MVGRLEVFVVNANDVPNVESLGKSDPYVQVEYAGQSRETEVLQSNLNPVWNEKLEFELGETPLSESDQLFVYLKDWERIGRHRALGQAKVDLKEFAKGKKTQKLALNLVDKSDRKVGATLNLTVTYNAPAKPKSQSGGGGGTVVGGEEDEDDMDEEEDDEGDDEADGDEGDGTGAPKKKKKKKKTAARKIRGKYSNKPQDFQVRIKIVEARQLPGANISPVSRVTCYNQTKQTRIKKSTNSPFWNEMFFFNFFCSPEELLDQLLSFSVFNSRKLRSDALIGSFKMDLGMVFDEDGHSLMNKWLLLSDPDDQVAGAKGYLKICAIVLGPGDEAPSFKPSGRDDDEDIESNLLRPAGIQLRPATFKLRLYRAEDLPRMDAGFMENINIMSNKKKALVDPYVVIDFAGQQVQTPVIYTSDAPEYNLELRLGLRFPSMCEKIKIRMMDWDRATKDDCMATAILNLRELSTTSVSDGFLPTFGPTYVNFYGSKREYDEITDKYEYLNFGKGEGMAYRCRILMELQTVLGEFPEKEQEAISQEDVFRVQKFLRRRKYKLHCAFMNANMVCAKESPVEFEISIGDYGNILDETLTPSSSSTPPTNAVFDGCYYYYLPWGDQKPCAVVDSNWEDISFRLEALNLMNYIIERLEINLEKVKIAVKANMSDVHIAKLIEKLVGQLQKDLTNTPLPTAVEGRHIENELDRHLRSMRESEMQNIAKAAGELMNLKFDKVDEAIAEMESFLAQLQNLAIEPQQSMPDVIIWMITGKERIAYFRTPAHTLLWSAKEEYRGKFCGKLNTVQLKYPDPEDEDDSRQPEIPALLRLKLWLGLNEHEHEWHKLQNEGQLAVFAETYENQTSYFGNWTTKNLKKPNFSDISGDVELKKESFEPPPTGWSWDGEWFINPELSATYEKDAGHTTFMEDIYQNESRLPGGYWQPSSVPYTDVKGDQCPGKDEIELSEGWVWDDDWNVDLNRAVDEEGWEYTIEATMGGYGPVEKRYHLCRRRRWVRMRHLVKSVSAQENEENLREKIKEGWEYGVVFSDQYHLTERKMDTVRRRRWHRKLTCQDPTKPCLFMLSNDSSDSEDESDKEKKPLVPRMFLDCTVKQKYQLRAYIYQARELLAGDSNGLSDPFTRIAFLNQSQVTEKLEKTLCPTWDQTLIFDSIEIHGDPESIAQKPPEIIIEIFDHDTFGEAEFLGRTSAYPIVKLNPLEEKINVLQWYTIKKHNLYGGEILAAFELLMMNGQDLPYAPAKRKDGLYMVPSGIRPVMQRTAIEVMCWGVRNMQKFQLANVSSPSIEFEVGGNVLTTKSLKNTKKNPNYDDPLLFFDLMLPVEAIHLPPMNMRVRDNRPFGRKPMVGIHVLKTLEKFKCDPQTHDLQSMEISDNITLVEPSTSHGDTVINMDEKQPMIQRDEAEHPDLWDEDIDWWSKYYASNGELDKCKSYLESGYDKIEMYDKSLEKMYTYDDFTDFCHTFTLSRGKNIDDEESNLVGEIKGTLRVYPLPGDPNEPMPPKMLDNLPPSAPEECIIRVYVVRAIDLQPNDPSGLADPYVCLKLGKKKADNKESYSPNTLNPIFGQFFEMKATLPMDKDLLVQIKDYDLIGTDDVIGETVIDLENRLLTKYRAICGLPKTYCITGPTQWRDAKKPTEILEFFCRKHNLAGPIFSTNTTVKVANREFDLIDFEHIKPGHGHEGPAQERLALYVLHCIPKAIGVPLVLEHIETRALFNPLQPGIEQGKIQMWVDIFPQSLGDPGPPVDISPRKAKKYELRIVVWNTTDVILEETSVTGEQMSDIYVKGWIAGVDEKQETDVHYRSLDGDGNFNWRFVFPFEYLPAEESLVVKRKEHFWSLDETELHLTPNLVIQIWDNDKFSADDFLGTLEVNLTKMPAPAKKSSDCSLKQLPDMNRKKNAKPPKMISLFENKRVKGFWPCFNDETGERVLTGKVEMELELVTEDESLEKPAGLGRDDPNQYPLLEAPNRPETSFLWFTSPLKTLKYIIWRNYKWYFILGIIILLTVIFIILFIYAIPGASVNAMFS